MSNFDSPKINFLLSDNSFYISVHMNRPLCNLMRKAALDKNITYSRLYRKYILKSLYEDGYLDYDSYDLLNDFNFPYEKRTFQFRTNLNYDKVTNKHNKIVVRVNKFIYDILVDVHRQEFASVSQLAKRYIIRGLYDDGYVDTCNIALISERYS